MPGYQINYHKNGINPAHTKAFFTEHAIATVNSIILTNLLTFMFKYHFYKHSLPLLITKLILPDAPTFNYNLDSDIVKEWLAHHYIGYNHY